MLHFIKKGLLLTVVLSCFYLSCNPSPNLVSPKRITSTTKWDSTSPNPIQYLLFGSKNKTIFSPDTLSEFELQQLRDGDILLRKGHGAMSDYIADFLQEKYPVTHCAFLIQTNSASPKVLHTLSNNTTNGMLVEPLSNYLQQSQKNSLVLVRLKYDAKKVEEVLSQANRLLIQQVPFDLSFDDGNSKSLYCIEMMRDIFLTVFQEDLLSKRTAKNTIDVLSMDNFFDSTHFELIFNHFELNNN